jgi:hypothetical protein
LLDLCGIDDIPPGATARAGCAAFAIALEEPPDDKKGDDGEGEEGGDIERGFLVGHCVRDSV